MQVSILSAQDPASNPHYIDWQPGSKTYLGSGYDIDNPDEWKPSPLEFSPATVRHGRAEESRVSIVTNTTELAEALDINFDLSVKKLSFKLSDYLNINESEIFNSSSISLVFQSTINYGLVQVPPKVLLTTFADAKLELADKKEFVSTYGNYYISSQAMGAKVVIILTIHNISQSSKRDIYNSLSVSGKMGGARASANLTIQSEFKKAVTTHQISIQSKVWGDADVSSISKILEAIRNTSEVISLDSITDMLQETMKSITYENAVPLKSYFSPLHDVDLRIPAHDDYKFDDSNNFELRGIWSEYQKVTENISILYEIISDRNNPIHRQLTDAQLKSYKDTFVKWVNFREELKICHSCCLYDSLNCDCRLPDLASVPNYSIIPYYGEVFFDSLFYDMPPVGGDSIKIFSTGKLYGFNPEQRIIIQYNIAVEYPVTSSTNVGAKKVFLEFRANGIKNENVEDHSVANGKILGVNQIILNASKDGSFSLEIINRTTKITDLAFKAGCSLKIIAMY